MLSQKPSVNTAPVIHISAKPNTFRASCDLGPHGTGLSRIQDIHETDLLRWTHDVFSTPQPGEATALTVVEALPK